MSYFAGLDVSLRSVSICVIDGDGKITLERTVPFEIEDVVACLRSVDGVVEQVGFEAGVMSQHLYHGLTAFDFDTICAQIGTTIAKD
ncbi:MAG: IS110 family transposase, partial [Pseudomonadota bacterium]